MFRRTHVPLLETGIKMVLASPHVDTVDRYYITQLKSGMNSNHVILLSYILISKKGNILLLLDTLHDYRK